MTQEQLNIVLEDHKLWLETNGEKGQRANLTNANLTRANLTRADLRYANLTNAGIPNFQLSKHRIIVSTKNQIQIGCKIHSPEFWLKNYKEIGKNEGYSEVEIEAYGVLIQYIINYVIPNML